MSDVREANRSAILGELFASSPIRRADIADLTGLSGATVSRSTEGLIAEGLVREIDVAVQGTRGRPASLLEIVADQAHVAGLDLGASNTRIVVTDAMCTVLSARSIPTPPGLDSHELVSWITGELSSDSLRLGVELTRISVGLPGAVNVRDLSVSNAPNLAVVQSPGFFDELEAVARTDVSIDNDANYALLGEQRYGAARDASTAVMLTIGAGLGAGISIEGKLLRGRYGLVGEFGQLPVGPLGTPLENMVTGPGIMRHAAELGIPLASPADLFEPQGDRALRKLRQSFEEALLIVLAAAVVSCEPDVIVLGGGISQSLAPDLPGLEAALRENLGAGPSLRLSALGEYSGAIGAVVASLHRLYRSLGISGKDRARAPRPSDQLAMPGAIR